MLPAQPAGDRIRPRPKYGAGSLRHDPRGGGTWPERVRFAKGSGNGLPLLLPWVLSEELGLRGAWAAG